MSEDPKFIKWYQSFLIDLKEEKCGSLSKMKHAAAAWDEQERNIFRLKTEMLSLNRLRLNLAASLADCMVSRDEWIDKYLKLKKIKPTDTDSHSESSDQ